MSLAQNIFYTLFITSSFLWAGTLQAKSPVHHWLKISAGEESLIKEVVKNDGQYTPALRKAFLKHAEREVFKQLQSVEVTLSEKQINFLHKDQDIYLACYGFVYPADARIALNILELRHQLGEELFSKYKNLAIAGAVTRRHKGLEAGVMGEKEEYCTVGPIDPKDYRWRKFSVVNIKPQFLPAPPSPKKPTPLEDLSKRKKKKRLESEKLNTLRHVSPEGISKYMAFLKQNNLTPSDTYADKSWEKKALAAMGKDAPLEGKLSVSFYNKIMHTQGLRPPERDPFPSMADFIKHLDSLDQQRFPIQTAPWPILYPLAKGWPLREASDIVERHKTAKKLITYGKYQNKKLVYQHRFLPFKWHYNSWQGKVQAGGVCHQMSSIGVGTYQSLGIPACKAGKPHHSFLIYFQKNQHGYYCKAKQGSAKGGHAQWGFSDPISEYPIFYHQGLAEAMNLGLNSYIDTRIAVHLSKILIAQGKGDLAQKLLLSAAPINPYNAQVWMALKLETLKINEDPATHRAKILHSLEKLTKEAQQKAGQGTEPIPKTNTKNRDAFIQGVSKEFQPNEPAPNSSSTS